MSNDKAKLEITNVQGQRYALWMDGKYYASGMYSFVKRLKDQLEGKPTP